MIVVFQVMLQIKTENILQPNAQFSIIFINFIY
jgi:hypothetical protein